MTDHQKKQLEVIKKIEEQVKGNSLNFSTVSQVEDYENDPRLCLTSVHFPDTEFLAKINEEIIDPLKKLEPDYYYYSPDSLHMTIKNIRVVNDPPTFTQEDIKKAQEIFSKIIPRHKKFKVYFYRLFLFPNNLSIIGTTDEELDKIILDLDQELKKVGVPDEKKYVNSRYFFSNMTLVRFSGSISEEFKKKIKEISSSLSFEPYTVDSVTLITSNAALKKRKIIDTWSLN